MARLFIAICLLIAFFIWLVEKRVRLAFGLPAGENCATWAADHFDYDAGDGLVLHRTVSKSWVRFPHVAIMRGARQADRQCIELIEYVPKVRDMDIQIPPRHFDGVVRRRRYVAVDSHPKGD